MKLLTLNLWQGRLHRNYPDFFKAEKADIICLQEVYEADNNIPTLEFFSSVSAAKEFSGLSYEYFSPVHSYEVMGTRVKLGNCILSRHPILKVETVFTHGKYREFNHPSEYIGNSRNAQIIQVSLGKGPLCIVNHHGYWEADPNGSDESLKAITKLSNVLKPIKDPLIMVGDFNLNSNSRPIKFLKEELDLVDLTEKSGIKSTLSKQVTPYTASCDHVFINNGIKLNDFRISDELLSDHKALITEFDLK